MTNILLIICLSAFALEIPQAQKFLRATPDLAVAGLLAGPMGLTRQSKTGHCFFSTSRFVAGPLVWRCSYRSTQFLNRPHFLYTYFAEQGRATRGRDLSGSARLQAERGA